VLFAVRGVSAFPAAERAKAIAARIRAVAADRTVSPESLRVVAGTIGFNILAGDRPLMTVIDIDASREGVSPQVLAEVFRRRIAGAVATYRAERTPQALGIKAGIAFGATLASAALLWGAWLLFRRLDALLDRRLKTRVEGLETQSFRLIQARQIFAFLHGFVSAMRVVLVAVIAYAYLTFTLELFPWSRPIARELSALFLSPLATMGDALIEALPKLTFLVILILVVRYFLKLVRLFFAGVESGTIPLEKFDREWVWPTYRIVRFLTVAFAAVVAYPYIPGSQSPAFQGVSIFIGVIFSLGSSSFVANLIAGYSMTYRRAFRVGDRIRVGDVTGDVTESGLMVTRVRTVKNEEIVVPNSTILSNHIVNYSALAQKGGLILHTTVGIGYETPWRQVEAMLLLAADRTPGLLKEPRPFVLHTALGDFCVTYEINAYCSNAQAMGPLYTALHRNILDVFNEYGVQIMTPAYEGDPEQAKVVPKAQWFLAPAQPPDVPATGGA
jgi:small-conductance mechanosensitive channel